jgi:hypothetical protein
MSFQELGNIGEFIGGIATIATLAYLAFQIRQNNRTMRAQTRANIGTTTSEILLREAENLDVVRALLKAEAGEELGPEEDRQLRLVAMATFRHWENVYYQYRQGLYDSTEFEAHRETWNSLVSVGWQGNYWKLIRHNFSTELQALIDNFPEESASDA